jgi:hypothetical protein
VVPRAIDVTEGDTDRETRAADVMVTKALPVTEPDVA